DIQTGDAVVHLNHGIGIFQGIERIKVLDKEKDYILITYADKQKLFVPLEQADLIGRYTGSMDDDKKVKLDSLSGKSWQKKRVKAQEDIIRFAKALVESHAKRIALEGIAFPHDGEEQKLFEDKFPYIETPDQIKVIEEIKADMEDPKPMDRLLCGDVGFGKTEIALRAAFKAVYAGTQAAMLAPTTILAEQHYLTCLERFKDFPVKVGLISRFTEYEDRKEILKKLAAQEIDILIGTHALLSKDVHFKNLGLLVIDEEHKFGVEQKEKIKALHPLTDILSLSATPIPRTLSLALGSLRSFSTLQTPPELRIPVETIVSDFREDIVRDAIRSELDRGGQVYFIQNRIKELESFADMITNLVPEASVAVAHGRMDEDQLEDAFLGFMRGAYNVLISTTIVESGLDIPNANTLIVSDSQRLGLSQLYQLKGRVGRSSKQAFAYFLFPEHKNITESANKRLDALAEYTELGAGFQIARQDMEIRGAGNILGEEQHGHLSAVGYDMYMRLLREEVQKLQGVYKEVPEPLVDLAYDAFIPDHFISEPSLKMEAYKKILSLQEQDSADELKKELRDRFGALPPELDTLFAIARLKIEAGKIGIASVTEKTNKIEIIFSSKSQADPLKVMEIAQNGVHPVKFSPFNPNLLTYDTFDASAEQKVHRLMSFIRDIR
ncbi:MAG: transcription-repair coupling factor, partial [Brevinema sp.]